MSSKYCRSRLVPYVVILALLPAGGVSAGSALARQDIVVQTNVADRSVYVGQPVRVSVSVNGSQSPGEPIWPQLDGIDVQPRGGQSTTQSFTSFVNGRREERRFEGYVFNYELVFQKPGMQVVPALTVVVDGKEYRSNAVSVEVRQPEDRPEVRLRYEVDNTSPYVGEAIELRAVLYLRATVQNVAVRLPGVDGRFEVYDAPASSSRSGQQAALEFLGSRVVGERGQASLDGVQYDTFTMRKLLVPLREGSQGLGPGTLSCEVIVRASRSLFDDGQVQRVTVPSNEVLLDVKALPTEGRPALFTGLIGQYTITASASEVDVNVGDPITLTIRIGATGVVLRDPRIDLARLPGFADQFRVTEARSEPKRLGNQLVYEETIRPLNDSVSQIPPIEIPYFDTAKGEYAVASSRPIPLNVRPTRIVTATDAIGADPGGPLGSEVEDARDGIAHNYSADQSLSDQRFDLMQALQSPLWLASIGGPPALYFVALATLAWRQRTTRDQTALRQRQALAAAKRLLLDPAGGGASSAERVGIAVRQYIADRFARPVAGLTTADCVELVEPIDASLAQRLEAVLLQCDAARYGGAATEGEEMVATAQAVLTALDRATSGREGVKA